ncbi:CAMK family protein kinase [Histomonas meleagridis]|uniref:CAMK family protein kinase n=1 Tax=Histomonas meleagridis TaxID=135588 RepID=UPI00355A4ECC|nr:CAMK family protein kinase [Histomonas meleagridis]KAH0799276.1 CAMK family protein kinase [Histomonas meleagridis]
MKLGGMCNKQELGDYVIIQTIGSGSSSKVKLAEHKITHQHYAMKIIKKSKLDSNPDLRQKIHREIALMRLLDHPHLINLVDVLESQGHIYIVTEYASHGELFNFLIVRRFLTPVQSMHIFRQIIYGLDFLHTHNVCHRDLKPENILLTESNDAKIADFGFARWMKETTSCQTSCGSPHYTAPEVLRGASYDGRASDIWSCGVILYALLTGKLPFDDPSFRGLAAKVKSGIFRMPDLAPDLKDLLIKILTVNPKNRITIDGIKRHPAFRIGLPQEYIVPSPFAVPKLEKPIEMSTLSPAIIEFLHNIGYNDDEELRKDLESTESNMTKSFCVLLTHRASPGYLPWPSLQTGSNDASGLNSIDFNDQFNDLNLSLQEDLNGLNSSDEPNLEYDINENSTDTYIRPKDSSQGSVESFRVYSFAERSSLYPESFNPMTTSFPAKILFEEVTFPAEVVATELQKFLTQQEFEWLYPNDYTLIAQSEGFVVLAKIDPVSESYVNVLLQRIQGAADRFHLLSDQIGKVIDNISYEFV